MSEQSFQYRSGLGSIGSYQISGIPWASSSLSADATTPLQVDFFNVTRFIVVKNTSANKLRVGFSENGVNGSNYFLLGKDESFSADIRVTRLYLRGDTGTAVGSIVAGLTGITGDHLMTNWSGSAGVG
jgi:hypothetical protein